MDSKIAHGSVRQVELKRLPIIAIVEGDINRAFRSGKQQPLTRAIFANHIACSAGWYAVSDFGPGLAEIARAINVRPQIINAKTVDGGVCSAGLEVGSLDDRDFAPRL